MAKVKKSSTKKKPISKKSAAKKNVKGTKKSKPTKAAPKKKAAKKGKRKPETLMCFLTTACVNYYSLADDGYELTTLRNYRDTYLAASPGGKKLIQEYYEVSPEIVKRVNKDKEKRLVYEYIYTEIKSACSEIEKQNLLLAKTVYTNLVKTLMERYNLN